MHFKQYDYVLLDCPPNLYSTTKSAIFSADSCVVPYVPDYLSLSGFQVLAEQIAEMREKFAPYLPGRRKPNIGALIVSHYRQTGNVFRTGRERARTLHGRAPGRKVCSLIRRSCSNLIFGIVYGSPSLRANICRSYSMRRGVSARRIMPI